MMINSVIVKSSEAKIGGTLGGLVSGGLEGWLITKRCRTNGMNGEKILKVLASKLLAEQPEQT